jgi:hypothetical protein
VQSRAAQRAASPRELCLLERSAVERCLDLGIDGERPQASSFMRSTAWLSIASRRVSR